MKLKLKIFPITLCLMLCIAKLIAQQKAGYTLICKFDGLPDKSKVYLTTQEKDTVLSVLSDGNQIVFKGRLEHDGRFHFINFDTLLTKIGTTAIFLTNRKIAVHGSIGKMDIVVSGAQEQEEYIESKDLPKVFNENMKANQKALNITRQNILSDSSLSETEKKIELKKADKEWLGSQVTIKDEYRMALEKWLLDHKSSLYAPYVMLAQFGSISQAHVRDVFGAFPKRVQESYYGKQVKETIDMAGTSSTVKQGAVFPSLSVYNMEGKAEKILDVVKQNKFTLIDCWASWCKPCRAEVPELKKMYAKYKDKGFNIIGISSDKDSLAWKKAVKDDKTSWSHFIEDKTKLLTKAFNLQAIPAYILVDGEGKMIAFDCAMSSILSFGGSLRGEGLDKKLEELLGK